MNKFNFQKFLYSKKNILGMILSFLGISLYLTGLIDKLWFPIVISLYIFGFIIAPKEKTVIFLHFSGENLNDYIGFLNRLHKNTSEQLPVIAQQKFEEIINHSNELLNFMLNNSTQLDMLNQDIIDIKKIFDTYLPNVINQYIRLPKHYAENIKNQSGNTAKELLIQQLTLLNEQIKKVSYAVYENDAQSLKINGKILEQKFSNYNLVPLVNDKELEI